MLLLGRPGRYIGLVSCCCSWCAVC